MRHDHPSRPMSARFAIGMMERTRARKSLPVISGIRWSAITSAISPPFSLIAQIVIQRGARGSVGYHCDSPRQIVE